MVRYQPCIIIIIIIKGHEDIKNIKFKKNHSNPALTDAYSYCYAIQAVCQQITCQLIMQYTLMRSLLFVYEK